MKKIIILIAIFISIAMSSIGQNKNATVSTQKLDQITAMQLDKLTPMELSLKVLYLDSINKCQSDTMKKAAGIKNIPIPPQPPAGSTPMTWLAWGIALATFVVLWIISKLPFLQTVQIPIVQRFVSATSKFMLNVRAICVTISVIIPFVLHTFTLPDTVISILNNVLIVMLAIAGFTLITTKNHDLINPTPKVQS